MTWVEHTEVDDRSVHNMYKPLVNTGLAFGAKRWVATLDRQCERLASSMASNIPAGDLSGKYLRAILIKLLILGLNCKRVIYLKSLLTLWLL